MQLAVNAIAHFLVDATCLATLFSGRIPAESFIFAIIRIKWTVQIICI